MQTGEVGVTKAGDAERRRGLEETGVVTLERRPGLCFLARWERGATDGTRSPHGEPKLSESEPERPGLEHDEPAGGVQATPRREELGPLQLLFARLEQEPDDAATLSALCDLALTRGQPELAQRLIRQARATGRELPKELQALARRANATPSVLPQVLGTARDARSCCLLPVLIGLVSLLGALLGAGVMSVPDLRMRLRVSNQRGRLASSSFAERRAGTTWLTQEGLRLAKFVDSAEV
ncbi:MAG TPA: hypothetical protein DEA08_13385, partial [Planctomycetes bacterium]|nr:hypothetical protein [Planctomycetota bacterium]